MAGESLPSPQGPQVRSSLGRGFSCSLQALSQHRLTRALRQTAEGHSRNRLVDVHFSIAFCRVGAEPGLDRDSGQREVWGLWGAAEHDLT